MTKQPIEKFWRIVAQDKGDEPTAFDLMLFSTLGDPWSDETIWAKTFAEELGALPKSVKRLNLHINSPGGSVAEAQAIYSVLADHPSEKIVYIDGIAASAATIPACVGHKVYIRKNANMMIHLPMAFAAGNANIMRDAISMLESVTEGIISVYEKKTGSPREKLHALMEAETWMTADQAVELGFADETRGVIKAAASLGDGRIIFNGRAYDLAPFEYKQTPAFPEAIDNMKKTTAVATATSPPEPPTPAPPPVEEPRPGEPEPRPGEPEETASAFRVEHPQAAQVIFAEGVQAERARLESLEHFADPACAAIVAAARTDGRTASQIALECYDAIAAARTAPSFQRTRHADAAVLDTVRASEPPFIAPSSATRQTVATNGEAAKSLADAINRNRRKEGRKN